METLFSPEGSRQIIDRINSLKPISQNEWGTMNVSQMLVHCQQPIKVAFGDLKIKVGLLGYIFGRLGKRQLTQNNFRFKKDLPTAKEFRISGQHDFEQSRTTLIKMIEKFSTEGPDCIANKKHPFFGTLTDEQWGSIQWKHLDHHLKQFGA
ncbi:DUF1569 domain-containing protein [Flavobacterium sp. NST-5]|uniref:DUF1569 domain-containing protein n=1 Tax=Flavobacterium ichthyis TaxID=2698827 RepID=A0ABW9Z6L1_9FLAO|nr:DUF1569 domain-containing protein [Flavobacterium ichthyis]NBL64336.1 DUF1569 domain-containing protein [Flavobacterium ichthyis]